MTAPPVLHRRASLAVSLGLDAALLRRLDRARLIAPAGVDREGAPLLDAASVGRLTRVAELVRAGYPLADITHVLGRGDERPRVRPPRLLLASELGLPDAGDGLASLGPDAHRDDGAPLFLEVRCHALAAALALRALGAPELAAEVVASAPTPALVARLLTVSRAHAEAARTLRLAATRLTRSGPRRGLLRRRS